MTGILAKCSYLQRAVCGGVLIYFLLMDVRLYGKVQRVPPAYETSQITTTDRPKTVGECETMAVATATRWDEGNLNVKFYLNDPWNQYVMHPLTALLERLTNISLGWPWLSPNAITTIHIMIGLSVSYFLIRSPSLIRRQLGAFLFMFGKEWLDVVDGHVARTRIHLDNCLATLNLPPRFPSTTFGYYYDGFADGVSVAAVFFACLAYVKRKGIGTSSALTNSNPIQKLENGTKRSPSPDDTGYSSRTTRWCRDPIDRILERFPCTKTESGRITACFWIFGILVLLSSVVWNQGLIQYQKLLEDTEGLTAEQQLRQNEVFRSTVMFLLFFSWRYVNGHGLMLVIVCGIWADDLWRFQRIATYFCIVYLPTIVILTYIHITKSQAYILGWHNDSI